MPLHPLDGRGVLQTPGRHVSRFRTRWYEEKGRYEIFAGGKSVGLESAAHSLVLDPDAIARGGQTDLDEKGIAKTAREEKLRARDRANEDARMAELCRQVVLKEARPELATGPRIQGLKK